MTRRGLVGRSVVFAFAVLPWAAACAKKDDSKSSLSSAGSATSMFAAASAAQTQGAQGPAPSTCHVTTEKVWTKTPTTSAGMTPTVFEDGRIALGLVLDGKPQVIVLDAKGEGDATAVALSKDLRAPPKDKAKRVYSRITPALGSGGSVIAFADYKETSDQKRRVLCGPTDSTKRILEFDGKPLIAEKPEAEASSAAAGAKEAAKPVPGPSAAPPAAEKTPPPSSSAEKTEAPAAAEAPAGGPRRPPMLRPNTEKERLRLKQLRQQARARAGAAPVEPPPPQEKAAAPAPSAAKEAAPAPKKEAAKTESAGKEKVRELRECRTFVDPGGEHAWVVGSELVGDEQKNGTTKYSIVFFVQRELGRGRVDLQSYDLGIEPEDIFSFEAPTAHETAPGTFVLTTRYRGTLLAWSLDADKRPRGGMRSYGGFSTPVQFAADGSPLLLLSQRVSGGRYELRYARPDQSGSLPAQLSSLMIPGRASSLSDPHLVLLGTQRWLSYRAGETSPSGLRLSPVNDRLWAESTPLALAEPTEQVTESQLFALGSNRLLAAYIRVGEGKPQLVTKVLTCG